MHTQSLVIRMQKVSNVSIQLIIMPDPFHRKYETFLNGLWINDKGNALKTIYIFSNVNFYLDLPISFDLTWHDYETRSYTEFGLLNPN